MKTGSLCLMYLACVSCAGQDRSSVKIEEDALLRKLQASLPSSWSLKAEGSDSLIVRGSEPVWVLLGNRINAPMNLESDEERTKRIQTHGRKGNCELVFRCEAKWSSDKVQQAEAHNRAISDQLAKLPEKHDVARLLDARLSRKGDEYFQTPTPEDEKRVGAYKKEREELQSKIVRLPDFNSEKHSLFLESKNGCEDEFHIVHPPEAARELASVEQTIRDLQTAK